MCLICESCCRLLIERTERRKHSQKCFSRLQRLKVWQIKFQNLASCYSTKFDIGKLVFNHFAAYVFRLIFAPARLRKPQLSQEHMFRYMRYVLLLFVHFVCTSKTLATYWSDSFLLFPGFVGYLWNYSKIIKPTWNFVLKLFFLASAKFRFEIAYRWIWEVYWNMNFILCAIYDFISRKWIICKTYLFAYLLQQMQFLVLISSVCPKSLGLGVVYMFLSNSLGHVDA